MLYNKLELMLSGLIWMRLHISYDSRPNVSTLSSVFIRGDLKLLRDSFYTLTNERLFLSMRCKSWGVS